MGPLSEAGAAGPGVAAGGEPAEPLLEGGWRRERRAKRTGMVSTSRGETGVVIVGFPGIESLDLLRKRGGPVDQYLGTRCDDDSGQLKILVTLCSTVGD